MTQAEILDIYNLLVFKKKHYNFPCVFTYRVIYITIYEWKYFRAYSFTYQSIPLHIPDPLEHVSLFSNEKKMNSSVLASTVAESTIPH